LKNHIGIIFILLVITIWISTALLVFGYEHLAYTAVSEGTVQAKDIASEKGYERDIVLAAAILTVLIAAAWLLLRKYIIGKVHLNLGARDETAYIPVDISELQKENRILRLQSQLDEEISHLESSRIEGKVLDFLKDELNLERVSIAILAKDDSGFYVLDERKVIESISKGDFIPFRDVAISGAVEARSAIYTRDISKRAGFPVDEKLFEAGIRSDFIVPLIYEDRCIGTINAGSSEVDGISKETRDLILLLATRVAQALRNASLYEELKLEKERLDVTLNGIGDAVIATDTKGAISLINRVTEEFTGVRLEDVKGKPLSELCEFVSNGSGMSPGRMVESALREGKPFTISDDLVCIKRNGNRTVVRGSCSPIMGGNGKAHGAVIVLRDVTKERLLEQEINKSRKLESLGVLAGGIAHDFNNILTAILGNVTLARLLVKENDEAMRLLGEAENAVSRAKGLTLQLLTFSRGGEPIKKLSSVAEVVFDTAKFILTGTDVRLEIDMPKNLWPVELDRGQMSQVIQNIVLNAREAMPSGGTIRIGGRNVSAENAEGLRLPSGKRFVELWISDEGIGIPEKYIDKIFDPYFTTKEQGSGLGLSIAFSIVKNHDGFIRVNSIQDEGTTFNIFLPASQKVSEEILEEAERMEGEGGRVLVMDDEEIVRNVVRRMLETLGYDVETAEDGKEAVESYKKAISEGRRFDTLIMDLTVPGGMGGREAVAKILEIDPTARAIVSSGYSNDPVMANHRDFGFVDVISKPFKIKELETVLYRVLAKERKSSNSR